MLCVWPKVAETEGLFESIGSPPPPPLFCICPFQDAAAKAAAAQLAARDKVLELAQQQLVRYT